MPIVNGIVVLDENSYWAYIDYHGVRTIYGVGSNWRYLFEQAKVHAASFTEKNSLVEVGVFRRNFIGHSQPLVVKEQISH